LERYCKSNVSLVNRASSGTKEGREINMEFEEKYKFCIDNKHLERIKTDLKKIYQAESMEIIYEELLIEHKLKMRSKNFNKT